MDKPRKGARKVTESNATVSNPIAQKTYRRASLFRLFGASFSPDLRPTAFAASYILVPLRGLPLQPFHRSLQFSCNLLRLHPRWKLSRRTYPYRDLPRRAELPSRLLQLEQAVNPHRQNRNSEIGRQQPDPGAKRIHPSIGSMPAFREDEHTVTTIHSLARVREASPETGFARERK